MKDITNEEKGYAKINLALHVTGIQADGYHALDSIVVLQIYLTGYFLNVH